MDPIALSEDNLKLIIELQRDRPSYTQGASSIEVSVRNGFSFLTISKDAKLVKKLRVLQPKQGAKILMPLCTTYMEFIDLLFTGKICFTKETECVCREFKCHVQQKLTQSMSTDRNLWTQAMTIIMDHIHAIKEAREATTSKTNHLIDAWQPPSTAPKATSSLVFFGFPNELKYSLPVALSHPWISFSLRSNKSKKDSFPDYLVVELHEMPTELSGRFLCPFIGKASTDESWFCHRQLIEIQATQQVMAFEICQVSKESHLFIFEYEIGKEASRDNDWLGQELVSIPITHEVVGFFEHKPSPVWMFTLKNFKNSVFQIRNDTELYLKTIVESFGGLWLDQFSDPKYCDMTDVNLANDRVFHAVFTSVYADFDGLVLVAIQNMLQCVGSNTLQIAFKPLSFETFEAMAKAQEQQWLCDDEGNLHSNLVSKLSLTGLSVFNYSPAGHLSRDEGPKLARPCIIPIFLKPSIFGTGTMFKRSIEMITSKFKIYGFFGWKWTNNNFDKFYPNCLKRPFGKEWKTYLQSRNCMVVLVDIERWHQDQLSILRNTCLQARIKSKLIWTRNICHCPSSLKEAVLNWAGFLAYQHSGEKTTFKLDLMEREFALASHSITVLLPFTSPQLKEFTVYMNDKEKEYLAQLTANQNDSNIPLPEKMPFADDFFQMITHLESELNTDFFAIFYE